MRTLSGEITAEMPVEQDPAIGRFLDLVWMERGLSSNTLAAYRADLLALARWLAVSKITLTHAGRGDLLAFISSRAMETRM